MAIRYTVCTGYVRVDIVGEHTVADLKSLIGELASDPAVVGSPYLLVDLTQAEPSFRTNEVGPAAALHAPLLRHGLRAVLIVASKTYVFGMARGYAIQAESADLPVHVFRSEDEAQAWIASDAADRYD